MRKLPLVILVFSLLVMDISAQTKKKTKDSTKKTSATKPVVVEKPVNVRKMSSSTKPEVTLPASTITLPKFEAEIFAELNLFRTNPQSYVKYLEDFLKTYDGKNFVISENLYLQSFEGKKPVEEVIEILKQTNSLPLFYLADGMVKGASDHAQDLTKNNKTGHTGTDGSLPSERVRRYGVTMIGAYENISYGPKTARDVVMTMLIDDGVASRSHRKNLLNPQLKFVGLATGENKTSGTFCVLVLTSVYSDKTQ